MKNQESETFSTQSGSMLIWIFVLIGLFAALSFALSRGSGTGESTAKTEKARLTATELIQYAVGAKSAVKSLLIADRCLDTQISFEGALGATSYTNAAAPSDNSCHIFESAGGGFKSIRPVGQDQAFSGEADYNTMFFSGSDSLSGAGDVADADLWLYVPYLQQSVCEQINLSLLGSATIADIAAPFSGTAFTGTYTVSATNTFYSGKTSGCFHDTSVSDKGYVFYYVLHAR